MKKLISIIVIQIFFLGSNLTAQESGIKLPTGSSQNFIIISDHGRNGYYNQKEVADMMVRVATEASIRYFVTAGDNFQINGPQSTQDPLWNSSFENIYTHPSTYYDWYPALGNHDHGGNIQAQIDYSNISRRWCMPSNYYTLVKDRNNVTVRLVILDTHPMFMALSGASSDYSIQDVKKQLVWTDSVLSVSKEDWVIVVGHHPVYSAHPSRGNTEELVEHLNPILKKHNVDFYVGGHDHIFQHMRDPNSKVDYFVNTAGSEVRSASSNEMTVFAASSPGFSIVSATKSSLSIYFINIDGKAIYRYSREKQTEKSTLK
jgi:hypothetical protein